MFRRILISLAAGLLLVAALGTTPATAAEPDDLMDLCATAGHGCGTTVDPADARIVGEHFGHNIGSTLDEADVTTILELAEQAASAHPVTAASGAAIEPTDRSKLLELCDAADHGCGNTVDPADLRILADHVGHGYGTTIDPGDVEAVLEAAEQAARTSSVWYQLAECESSGNWSHSGGFYEGGLQFHPDTWDRNKPSGYPDAAYQATPEQQIVVGERVQAASGWDAWGHCAEQLGLS